MENKKYDLEKAKEDCRRHEDALEEAQSCMCGHCHECGFDPSEMKAALDEIDQQAKQIEALKEMLVSMTTTAIWKASYDSLTGKYTISDADAEKMARQQLKADPDLQKAGVAWDE